MLVGKTAFQEAKKKARYGHRDWVCWVKDGESYAVRATDATIKQMMLAVGTKGTMFLCCKDDGMLMNLNWWVANNIRRQFKAGYRF